MDLRALRLRAGLSGEQLAERIGTSQSRVSRTETARYRADLDMVRRWLDATDADAETRRRLWAMGETTTGGRAAEPFSRRPHLVYFLHDELVVHAPAELAPAVADEVRSAAAAAGRLLFGDFPVEFPLSVGIADAYGDAKGG